MTEKTKAEVGTASPVLYTNTGYNKKAKGEGNNAIACTTPPWINRAGIPGDQCRKADPGLQDSEITVYDTGMMTNDPTWFVVMSIGHEAHRMNQDTVEYKSTTALLDKAWKDRKTPEQVLSREQLKQVINRSANEVVLLTVDVSFICDMIPSLPPEEQERAMSEARGRASHARAIWAELQRVNPSTGDPNANPPVPPCPLELPVLLPVGNQCPFI